MKPLNAGERNKGASALKATGTVKSNLTDIKNSLESLDCIKSELAVIIEQMMLMIESKKKTDKKGNFWGENLSEHMLPKKSNVF